jgi:hypothetical protein
VDQILTTISLFLSPGCWSVFVFALGNKWSGERAGVCFHAAFLPFQPAATTESAFKIKPRVRRGRVCEKKGGFQCGRGQRVINHTASEYNWGGVRPACHLTHSVNGAESLYTGACDAFLCNCSPLHVTLGPLRAEKIPSMDFTPAAAGRAFKWKPPQQCAALGQRLDRRVRTNFLYMNSLN